MEDKVFPNLSSVLEVGDRSKLINLDIGNGNVIRSHKSRLLKIDF